MDRRRFLEVSAAVLLPQQKPAAETVTATATQDRTPRVAIILSTFSGSKDHNGTVIPGLTDRSPGGVLSKAIELGTTRTGGLLSIVEPEDWVVIQTDPAVDPSLVQALQELLKKHGRGKRFTVVTAAELAKAESQEMPVPGGERLYRIPKMILQCDRLLRVLPLAAVQPSLSPLEHVDRMSFHPPDYTILVAGELVVAGADPVAVESVGAQLLGLDPEKLPHLRLGAERGLGLWEPGAIWTRGNEIEEAAAHIASNNSGVSAKPKTRDMI
jgi:hypothetical protein